MSIDQLRREFMDKMDKLWTNQFDKAFKKIPDDSAYAYKGYADHLDEFFVLYWAFFNELNRGSSNETLSAVSKEKYEESIRCLEKVWLITTDAQLEKAEKLGRKRKSRKTAQRLSPILREGLATLKEARDIDMLEQRLVKYRAAAKLLGRFNKKVGKSA